MSPSSEAYPRSSAGPRFSIVTPSFRRSSWLKLCLPSVADQGVPLEHIVQEAGSDDGTLDWLRDDPRVQLFVEKDRGMYDALNRGFARARGEILAYLNCDEQYLPGALPAVGEFFERHPEVDLVFADFVVVDSRGEYLCHRKVQVPQMQHLRVSHLPAFSCAMFFRRELIHTDRVLFDPELRAVGDGAWVLRLLERGVRIAVLRRFTSVFTLGIENLGRSETARREARAMHARAPLWVRATKPLWILHHRWRRLAGGLYRQAPFAFALYTPDSPTRRIERQVTRPRSRWPASVGADA